MTNLFLPVMPTSPMFVGDEEKVMTIEWQEFFRNLFDRVGGISATPVDELENQVISEAYSTTVDYSKRIDDLEKRINSLPSPHSFGKELEELRRKIDEFPFVKSYDKEINEIKELMKAIPTQKSYDKEIAELSKELYLNIREPFKYYLPQKVYDDLQVSISNIKVPASNFPTERLYDHGIAAGVTFPVLGFDTNEYIYFDIQTYHAMKLSSILGNHIHFCTPTDGSGTPDRFQFQLDVIAAPINGTWAVPSGSPFTAEHTIADDYTDLHKLFEIANIPAVNTTVSTIYKCKLTRIAATQDEYSGEVYLEFTDCHYQKDTTGSRLEDEK